MSKKFIDLTQLTTPATGDIIPIHDVSAGSTKKVTVTDLLSTPGAIADNTITASMLATSAITLGHASTTSSFTTANQSATLITGLTTSVTIPDGGRRVKITGFAYATDNNVAASTTFMTIWDGGSGIGMTGGTQLASSALKQSAASSGSFQEVVAVVTPTAGSKTYNLCFHVNANTGSVSAGANNPAFILVEAI